MEIAFRPHHFLCALCFQGKGYTPEFVANFAAILAFLETAQGKQININVVEQTDNICSPCPHKRGKACTSQEKINFLDQNHGRVLNLKAGDRLTWEQAKQRIAEKVTMQDFHTMCATCQWKTLGICENVLSNFLAAART